MLGKSLNFVNYLKLLHMYWILVAISLNLIMLLNNYKLLFPTYLTTMCINIPKQDLHALKME